MIDLDFSFSAELWKWSGGNWHFVTVPSEVSADIRSFTRHDYKGFGSVRVRVRVGKSEWLTSVFPDKKSRCYFLPIKAAIRKTEKLNIGDLADVQLNILI